MSEFKLKTKQDAFNITISVKVDPIRPDAVWNTSEEMQRVAKKWAYKTIIAQTHDFSDVEVINE